LILILFTEIADFAPAKALRNLSEEELKRAARIRHSGDRLRFVLGRHLLQVAMAEITGVEKHYTVHQKENGKPYLADTGLDWIDFSISHSDRAVAVAISSVGRVGVDIERVNGIDPESIESLFTARELEDFSRLPAAERRLACISAWSEKEAIAKFHGNEESLCSSKPPVLRSWHLEIGPDRYQLYLAHELSFAEIQMRKEPA
jgi:4'-phosphopantetheinyl transferase